MKTLTQAIFFSDKLQYKINDDQIGSFEINGATISGEKERFYFIVIW